MEPLTVHRFGSPDAPPVLLVHGLTEAGTTWPDLVHHWGDRWDVHAPDLRGHGRSPRFSECEIAAAPAVLLADVVALVDALPGPVALVGHSLGGLLAMRAALARPEKVWALVLEDPAKPTGDLLAPAFVAATEEFLDAMADVAGSAERMLPETAWSRAEIEAWADCKPLVDRAYVRHGLHLGDAAWEELFDVLTMPTLLVVPPSSEMAPRVEDLRNDLVRTVVVPDSGHCVRRDQPARFHQVVDDFLSEHERPRDGVLARIRAPGVGAAGP
ncbi:alpha/beta fold hydrolase [Cellulomonas fimi]|uniref:Alpha/beta hydrolase n=1 Tax=Cellulomonas fimi TaxID=1708 RepID=A0A7Y0LW71_CELFI|nr:alpha/beta hydrolase [Cellulomonas fimi]NMR18949.1 alpha/beta hydrolase [Cellulomonas fimi]